VSADDDGATARSGWIMTDDRSLADASSYHVAHEI
jgi:hypothetical protein